MMAGELDNANSNTSRGPDTEDGIDPMSQEAPVVVTGVQLEADVS